MDKINSWHIPLNKLIIQGRKYNFTTMKISWKERNRKFRLGIILVSLSIFFFVIMVIIPFTNLSEKIKYIISGAAFILAEILFYTGGFFLGKEIFNKYKSYLNPFGWNKRKLLTDKLPEENSDKPE